MLMAYASIAAFFLVGIAFIVGSLLLGLFADKAVNGGIPDEGLFFGGGAELLGDQIIAVVAAIVFSGVLTYIIAKVIDVTMGLRVSEEDEVTGLDLSQHSETAYALGGGQYGELGGSAGAFAEAARAAEVKARPAH